MSEEILIRQGAPTLAGIKTGELVSLPLRGSRGTDDGYPEAEPAVDSQGALPAAAPLSAGAGAPLPLSPRRTAAGSAGCRRPRCCGRRAMAMRAVSAVWRGLSAASAKAKEFPHEVGLFLSYPPEDVKGFIDHRAGGFKCTGLWKVYGDEEKARSLFEKYRKCTEIYCTLWQSGSKLEQLAVAV